MKNEAAHLAACVARLGRFAEIAGGFGARVVEFAWDGRSPGKRNWFLLNAPPTQRRVLFPDADEVDDAAFCEAPADAVMRLACMRHRAEEITPGPTAGRRRRRGADNACSSLWASRR